MPSLYSGLLLTFLYLSPAGKQSSANPHQHAQKKAPETITAIVGGTLVNVRNGNEVENTIVLIRGDRVTDVGLAGALHTPTDARLVDAHGKWIIPGLIDMHAHLWANDDTEVLPLALFLANGVTSIRDPGDSVLVMRLTKDEIESGKRIGPRMFFCGDLLDGMPPLYRESTLLVNTPERAHSAVMFLADQGVNCIKVYNSIKEPELREIVRTAHTRNLPVIGHIPRSLTLIHSVELGMEGLEHIRITGKDMLPIQQAQSIDFLPVAERETRLWQQFDLHSEKMRQLVQFLADKKIFLDPTLVKDEYVFAMTNEEHIDNPNNRYLPPQLFSKWKAESAPQFNEIPAELKQAAIDGFEKRKEFVGLCSRAGVQVVAGTDGTYLGLLLPGFGLQHELELLVQSGLSPLQAIQAATINAAAGLRKGDILGAVEPGYFADLIVLEADPLKDIRNTQKIDLVIKAGQSYRRSDLLDTRQLSPTP